MNDRPSFEKCVLASGLVTPEQLRRAREEILKQKAQELKAKKIKQVTDEQLAQKLIEMGLINAWQARQLFKGRTKFNLGPYRILDSLGRGGMGEVFKAEHRYMKRLVAVKVLPRDRASPESIENFVREIRTLAQLDHPNLVRALDAGEDGNVHYLVTEYVPGANLRKIIRSEGPLDMTTAANIICQVAAGLHHAHQRGYVHRDVKPGNILITPDGHAKLSDLGLAGPFGEAAIEDPRYGKIVGTADYIAPDQIRDPRSPKPAWDIYSLGCTLYYAVTGKVPFPGGTVADKIRAHLELLPLDPRRLNPTLDEQFVDVMADMMAKDPAERIQSAAEVIARLAPWMDVDRLPEEARNALPAIERLAGSATRDGAAWSKRPQLGTPGADELPDTESSMPEQSGSQVGGVSDPNWPLQPPPLPEVDVLEQLKQRRWNKPWVFHPVFILLVLPVVIALIIVLLAILLENL